MISLAPETLFHVGSFPVTNTLIDTLVVDAILISIALLVKKNLKLIPGYFQNLIEMVTQAIYELTESVAEKRAARIFPYFMTFFLFILFSNWTGLFPILTSMGFYEHGELVPLVRSASTDLNTTLAFALVSVVSTHAMSIRVLGFKEYISRFISFNPFNLFVGLMELISEFTKIISFSFRLFGNIFVGETMLGSLFSFSAFILPIPVILYEFGVGTIQALIFGMLTMAFMAILTTPHSGEAEGVSHK